MTVMVSQQIEALRRQVRDMLACVSVGTLADRSYISSNAHQLLNSVASRVHRVALVQRAFFWPKCRRHRPTNKLPSGKPQARLQETLIDEDACHPPFERLPASAFEAGHCVDCVNNG